MSQPLPNTTTRKCLFRVRNANWLSDTGRVKEGDRLMFEITDDLCLGSTLQFKRSSKEWDIVKGEDMLPWAGVMGMCSVSVHVARTVSLP